MNNSNIYAFVIKHQTEVEAKVNNVLTEMLNALGIKTEKQLDAFVYTTRMRGYYEKERLVDIFLSDLTRLLDLENNFPCDKRQNGQDVMKTHWQFTWSQKNVSLAIRAYEGVGDHWDIGKFVLNDCLRCHTNVPDPWINGDGIKWDITADNFKDEYYKCFIVRAFSVLYIRILENKNALIELARKYADEIKERYDKRKLTELKIKQEDENDMKTLNTLLAD